MSVFLQAAPDVVSAPENISALVLVAIAIAALLKVIQWSREDRREERQAWSRLSESIDNLIEAFKESRRR